jgi:very-short-patch-repair endonuclease
VEAPAEASAGRLLLPPPAPVGAVIVDFCCTREKLCIEVDGGIHDEQRERDEERTAWLEALGYRVLRFANEEVLSTPHLVARRIEQELIPSGR